jgi:hypothetical protein
MERIAAEHFPQVDGEQSAVGFFNWLHDLFYKYPSNGQKKTIIKYL